MQILGQTCFESRMFWILVQSAFHSVILFELVNGKKRNKLLLNLYESHEKIHCNKGGGGGGGGGWQPKKTKPYPTFLILGLGFFFVGFFGFFVDYF